MKDTDSEGFEVKKESFGKVLNKFSTKKTKAYDFLLKSGDKFKESIYKLCKRMLETEEFPRSFRKTVLHQLWKGKGSLDILKNSRFIHIKRYLPRTCDAMVMEMMKEKIVESSSIFQVGGQPGHGPEEHLYTIKSLLSVLEHFGDGMVFTLVDIIAFFDRENIVDVMDTLSEIGVNKKAARLFFKLNEGTEIAVKTAGGLSETAVVGDCIGQGTAGGAIVSAANLDQGLKQYFNDSKDEVYFGNVRLQPVAYQDDLGHANKDVQQAQVGNTKLACMLQDKGLQAHEDKTCYIVFGSKKYKENVKKDLEHTPLMFGKFPLKQRVSEKYLGQILHSGGLSDSAKATVEDRSGKIRGAAIEIKSIVEEFEMQAMGGLMAAWELWSARHGRSSGLAWT